MEPPRTEPPRIRPRRRELLGMRWVWSLGGLTLGELARRVWREIDEDDVLGRAAQLAYFFLFSLFPLLIFATSVTGLVLGSDEMLLRQLLIYSSRIMPHEAFGLLRDALKDIASRSGAGGLSIGLLAALWSGSSGMVSIIEGLNSAYGIRERRGWWKRRLIAVVLTVVLLTLGVVSLILVLAGGRFGDWLSGVLGASAWFPQVWIGAQWVFAATFMLLVFNLIYLFAPNLAEQRWQAIMPGSLVALICWAASSFSFKLYLRYFDSYSKTYGAVGAIIVLLLWLYITGIAILVGGEVNSEIRAAAAAAGAKEAQKTRESEG